MKGAPMTPPHHHGSDLERLRHMVDSFNSNNETQNDSWTLPQLVAIYEAWMQCGWDIHPDNWTPRQITEALDGIAPDWTETTARCAPLYSDDRAETRRIKPGFGSAGGIVVVNA